MSPEGSLDGDVWKTKRDTSSDPPRAPGPIHLNRYVLHPPYSGIQTFCKVPVCLTQEDLRAGKVDVAICGVPIDTSIGQRGAAHGPMAIRAAEKSVPGPRRGGFPHQHVRIDPFEVLHVVDYGDAAVHPLSIEESHQPIRQLVREIAETGATPIVLGGDHSVMWPSCAALADVYGAGNIGVVHFDAHADCSAELYGHLHSHGTPIRRLIEEEHVPARNFIQVGLRGYYPSDELFAWMQAKGMRSHFMAEVERKGFEAVMQRAIAEALDGPRHLYVSVDVDALDPAYAPGTGTPEPGGLTTRELFPMIRRLAHEIGIVGLEVVEVAPAHDPGYTTALNAHRIVLEALTGMAMRKKGIKGRHYLHPIAAGERLRTTPSPAGSRKKH
jgi:formimidoylglutamase